MKKHVLLLSLVLTLFCFLTGCGNMADESLTPSGSNDMVGNKTPAPKDSVLDKGGANGTDNDSILDYIQEDSTISTREDDLSTDHGLDETSSGDGIINDLGDGAREVIDDVQDGVDDLTAPSGSGPLDTNVTSPGNTNMNGTLNETSNIGGNTPGR